MRGGEGNWYTSREAAQLGSLLAPNFLLPTVTLSTHSHTLPVHYIYTL
ncbi:uncharacterized protein G2W53_016181 [Senna tora]|uniref:Uncharacterized protein n=1 Tax=Senna tora TaxID=362788 RepID=A0A834WXQ1_9FABA|nr:uncharacterized protein G2W53_016181 [Senna tora]